MKGMDAMQGPLDLKSILVFLVFVATVVWEMRFVLRTGILAGPRKRRENAIRLGHVVEGRRVSFRRVNVGKGAEEYSLGVYQYTVDGKTYKLPPCRFAYSEPPQTIEVYYEHDPQKGFANQGDTNSRKMLPFLILPFLTAGVVYWLLGCVFP